MRYMLDTNICIHLIRSKSAKVIQKLARLAITDVVISAITLGELQFGAEKSARPGQNRQALDSFLVPFSIVDFDYSAAVSYGRIRAQLEQQGMKIGPLDTLIAARALSRGMTLVTNNAGEFSRVPELAVEDWS